jgi:hypothetical protein
MTPAHVLHIAISELIESHCRDYQLNDADVLGALHAAIACEETALAFRMSQRLMKQAAQPTDERKE